MHTILCTISSLLRSILTVKLEIAKKVIIKDHSDDYDKKVEQLIKIF